jgi:hypothetical protein
MAQITQEQREQWQATVDRVSAKLQSFYETLPHDEQLVLDISLNSLLADQERAEVTGHSIPIWYRLLAGLATKYLPEMIDAHAKSMESLPDGYPKKAY